MKKFLIVLLAAFTAYQASGQETFGIAYTSGGKVGEFERGLLEVLDVEYMKADFSGNLKNKRIHVEEIVCRDGEFSTHVITEGDHPYYSNVNDMQLYIKKISQDSISVKVVLGYARFPNRNIALHNDWRFITMETDVKELMIGMPDSPRDTAFYPMDLDIPVMAFTSGAEGEGRAYCDLRDAQIHPREWYKEFGIKNYIYYTVRFE